MILQLFPIYWLPILAGVLASIFLSHLGIHLATRDRAMQTLCVSQGATFGVLLGMGLIPFVTHSESALHFGPIFFAFAAAVATSLFGESVGTRHTTSRNTYFTSIFAVLLGAGYLITALFPSLENHLTQIFFGDLATLSNAESILVGIVSSLLAALLISRWRMFANGSFEVAALGEETNGAHRKLFQWISWLGLCISVQYLGLLFTLTLLFLPTVILRRNSNPNLRSHLISVPILAAVSTLSGFLVSLQFSRLPTVPTIALTVLVIGIGNRVLRRD